MKNKCVHCSEDLPRASFKCNKCGHDAGAAMQFFAIALSAGWLAVKSTIAISAVLMFSGCSLTIPPSVIEAITNQPPAAITNIVPAKPVATSCGCDLSKPATIFASPVHGKDEAQVGAWLRQRWVDGKRDSCDGLPRDVRPQALNPSGKGPFNWKWAILGGGVRVEFNDKGEMRSLCGDVTVDGQTQRWHIAGCTNTEEGRKAADWTPMEPGVWVKQKHFVCFEIR